MNGCFLFIPIPAGPVRKLESRNNFFVSSQFIFLITDRILDMPKIKLLNLTLILIHEHVCVYICSSYRNKHKRWFLKPKSCLHVHQGTSLLHVRYRVCNLVQSSTDVDGPRYRVHDLEKILDVISSLKRQFMFVQSRTLLRDSKSYQTSSNIIL